jgi:L,D-transpeptidase catalytic domain
MFLLTTGLFCILQILPGQDTLPAVKSGTLADTVVPAINYHLDTLEGKTAIADFNAKYNAEQRSIILAINRISSSVIKKGKVLLLPDTITTALLDYSPFPLTLPRFDTVSKLILISLRIQAFAVYENGWLSRWGPVSSGKKSTPTPAGLFHTNFKAKVKISSENSSWIMPWYFNFYARRGIAMHQYFLPGYPASHACVRMQENDAYWIYGWADQWKVAANTGIVVKTGTPVIIFGEYDFSAPAPWLNLPADRTCNLLTEKETAEIYSYLPQIHTDVVLRELRK